MRHQRNLSRRGGVWYFIGWVDGRRYRVSLKTRDQAIAKERAGIVRASIAEKNAQAASGTVEEFSKRWLTEYVAQSRTARGVKLAKQRLRDYILPIAGNSGLQGVIQGHGRALRARCEAAGLKATTVRHVLSDFRCLLRYAEDCGLVSRVPSFRKILPRVPEKEPRPIGAKELQRIIDAAPPDQSWVIRFLAATGMRWSELRNLTWSNVTDRHLILCQTKNGRVRRVPITSQVGVYLSERKSASGGIFVSPFRGKNSCFISRRERGTVHEWNIHRLRDTFACNYLNAGGSLETLQQLLGHTTIRMTERYARLSQASVDREAAEILAFHGHRNGHSESEKQA